MFDHHHHFFILATSQSSGFWEGFWSNLLASLIVLLIASFTIPWYLDRRRRPHLKIINPLTRSNKFFLTRAHNGLLETTLDLTIKNETAFSQREWFWHILIPIELNPQFQSRDQTITSQHNEVTVNGVRWRHYFGSSTPKEVIFPKRGLRFNYEVKLMTTRREDQNYKIYYYFNTEFGTSPSKAYRIEEIATNPNIDPGTAFRAEYLDCIELWPETR